MSASMLNLQIQCDPGVTIGPGCGSLALSHVKGAHVPLCSLTSTGHPDQILGTSANLQSDVWVRTLT